MGKDPAGFHRTHQLGALGNHHRHRYRLDAVLHVGIPTGFSGNLDHADVVARPGVEDGKDAAEDFDVELVEEPTDERNPDDVFVDDEPAAV